MRTVLPLPAGQRPAVRVCAALLAAALFAICGLQGHAAADAASGAESVAAATRSDAAPEAEQVVLYLARRSWHIDVGFAVHDLRPSLAFSARRFPQAKYLFFGFGDRHYLMSKRKGTSTLAGALFPGRGLILVTAIENSPAQAFGGQHVLEFALSAPQTAAAQRFVRRALAGREGSSSRGEGVNSNGAGGNTSGEGGNSGESGNSGDDGERPGDIPALANGPYEGSVYYSAVARYSALHTCNTWAAEVLKSAGLSVHTHFVLFAGQIWNQARKLNTPATPRSTDLMAPTAPEGILALGGSISVAGR